MAWEALACLVIHHKQLQLECLLCYLFTSTDITIKPLHLDISEVITLHIFIIERDERVLSCSCYVPYVKKIRWTVWWTIFSDGHSLSSSKSNMVTCDSKIWESSGSSGESDVDLSLSSLILQNMAASTLSCKSVFLWEWQIWGSRQDCVDKLWETAVWKANSPKDKTKREWMKWVDSAKLVILSLIQVKNNTMHCLCFLHNIWSWSLKCQDTDDFQVQ